MAKKEVKTIFKLQIMGGAANPAPPVGPTLGQQGINIPEFCKKFNDATADKRGDVIPVEVTVYTDRSYTMVFKTPPAADLLKKAAGVKKGSGNPLKEKVGKVTKEQVRKIAETKMPDLNANTVEAAMKIIEGTARQMGIQVE